MKQILLGACVLAAFMPVEHVTTQSGRSDIDGTWSARAYVSDRDGADTTPKLQMQMNVDTSNGGWNNWGQSIPVSAFTGLPQTLDPRQDVRFELRREAGVVHFDGRFENGRGVGTMTFVPNREFARAMEQQTGDTVTDRQLFSYAVLDVSRAFVRELQALGYRDVTLADARKLRIHGVTPAFITGIKAAGLDNPTLAEVTKFRIHGVTLDYIKQMRALGLASDLDDIVDSRIHGVTPAFAKDMADLGYGDAGFRQLRKFRIHGVTPAFVRDMAALGYKNVDAGTLVKFRIHGITPSFVKELADAGYRNLSEEELVDWAIHGRRLLKTRKR